MTGAGVCLAEAARQVGLPPATHTKCLVHQKNGRTEAAREVFLAMDGNRKRMGKQPRPEQSSPGRLGTGHLGHAWGGTLHSTYLSYLYLDSILTGDSVVPVHPVHPVFLSSAETRSLAPSRPLSSLPTVSSRRAGSVMEKRMVDG